MQMAGWHRTVHHIFPFEDLEMKLKTTLPSIFTAILLSALLLIQTAPAERVPQRIEVVAKKFDFTPGAITLKKGEPVVLVLKSADVPHGIRFRELGIETKVGKGQTSELAFTPDKTGTFVGHCSVFCGSGHGTMTLTLVVVD
jgi:cytochrome c oxidase subunit 2